MAAIMVVYMNILDHSWIPSYFDQVPKILAEYGAISIAGGSDIFSIEGPTPPPGRIAILSFPNLAAVQLFMKDERYLPFKRQREEGAQTDIFVFENKVTDGELV